ncbi:MraY family glycosyltransferase [Phaeocystidibacter marisrubri]|uniref:Glycosyltransferase family 4 protein n=1 Tax=Phaeocystidibacter marisrubri TaxID=1577780 RepID=A0A6L3ZHY6_9FLAO|nr:glycosyltransferase family 4 protein [Phaeocystidibacter marisrubri]KAB2817612.1 glycosyltransferase family 4 protein [Phaeocystidibacter marisrubri]GGH74495.1 UDP-GlcNAc--UDP-phosphate GlcNAc-1-phosphate transferase [Phaeocystidibacter marisrubri]
MFQLDNITLAVLFSVFVLLEMLYIWIAPRIGIVDVPSGRSSHSTLTIRGGGIIFPISIFIGLIVSQNSSVMDHAAWVVSGLFTISVISFIDDKYTIKPLSRLVVHILSVVLLLWGMGFDSQPWYLWLAALVLIIGWINAFNFMDGINGITALYALSIIVPALFLYSSGEYQTLLDSSIVEVGLLSVLAFGVFNIRRKARTFAGDVGSVSMAFILAFILLDLMLSGYGFSILVFFSVYGVDTVFTILTRLKKGENIFEAHRTHLYQYLANEMKIPHVAVSAIYASIQLLINLGWIGMSSNNRFSYFILVLGGLVAVYLPFKMKLVSKIRAKA